MKAAVIGKGFIYPRHEKAIKNVGGEIVAVCDLDIMKGVYETDWVRFFKSEKMAEADTVVILTPNYLHPVMVREALSLGKRVLCEKPLTIHGPDDLETLHGANTVLQLRFHPLFPEIKRKANGIIDINVRTYREDKYWRSWKGDPKRSGGILYNMGIHYIDLMIQMLGLPKKILRAETNISTAHGEIEFQRGLGRYRIELSHRKCPTDRDIRINGHTYELDGATIPLKDTGQMIDLHTEVYNALLKGRGLGVEDAMPSIRLVDSILKHE